MEPLVSVLIPVYNSRQFIIRSLDSVINQSYKNLEIVVVDDCSTDGTQEILKEYEKKDKRLKVIYKSINEGVSSARDDLISNSSGEYIMFCDSDDYFELDLIKKVIKAISENDVDCVIFRYNLLKKGFKKKLFKTYIPNGKYIDKTYSKYHIKYAKTLFWGVLWNKCYKSKIIKENNIKFTKDLEDVNFNLKYLSIISSCYILSDCLYNYNQTNISLTRPVVSNLYQDSIESKILRKWNSYCRSYLNLIDCYSDKKLNIISDINLHYYLYSIFLEIKQDLRKYDVKGIIDIIKNDDIYIFNARKVESYVYLLKLKFIMNKASKWFKAKIIKFITLSISKVAN